jgi:hypothetical protein
MNSAISFVLLARNAHGEEVARSTEFCIG